MTNLPDDTRRHEEQMARLEKIAQASPKSGRPGIEAKKPVPTSTPKVDPWMNPLNKLIWQQAFKSGAKRMTLRDGRMFIIDYVTRKLYGEMTEMAWVQIDGFTASGPCGWFVVSKVLDPMWISKDQHIVTKTGV